MTSVERWECYRCQMSFQVREASRKETERLRCPDCGLAFWSAHDGKSHACIVGISPREVVA